MVAFILFSEICFKDKLDVFLVFLVVPLLQGPIPVNLLSGRPKCGLQLSSNPGHRTGCYKLVSEPRLTTKGQGPNNRAREAQLRVVFK